MSQQEIFNNANTKSIYDRLIKDKLNQMDADGAISDFPVINNIV